MSSPTQRSLKVLRDQYAKVEVVERWNQYAKIRQDLFQIIDIVCVGNGITTGVQTTSYSNMSARITKIKGNDAYPELKQAGWRIVVHGWKKNKKGRWELKEVEL